jgi:hypothetical protein
MNYAQIAAAAYQRCTHYDPYLPPVSADLARAWGTQFEKHRLSEADLLAAVDVVYDEHGCSGFRVGVKDITDAARKIRRDRDDRQDDHTEYEARCDAKALDTIMVELTRRNPDSRLRLPGKTIPAEYAERDDPREDVIDARIAEHVETITTTRWQEDGTA